MGKMNNQGPKISKSLDNGDKDPNENQVNVSLKLLLKDLIPQDQKALKESQINLEKIADYCDANYFQVKSKEEALLLTRNYTQQALASIASQIYSYAANIQSTINLMGSQFDHLESQTRFIEGKIRLNQEKCHRREIGLLTNPKKMKILPMIQYPDRPKTLTSHKFIPEAIDYSSLDNIGIAHKVYEEHEKSKTFDKRSLPPTKSAILRPSKSSNLSSIIPLQANEQINMNSSMYGRTLGQGAGTSSKLLPTNPSMASASAQGNVMLFGTLARNPHKDHRQMYPPPLVIPPPQVPSNYKERNKEIKNLQENQQQPQQKTVNKPAQNEEQNQKQSPNSGTIGNPQQNKPSPVDSDSIPLNYIEKVVAIYDYSSINDDELSFQENSVIYVIRKNDDGWWEGVLNGITGLFPGNYVEPCL